MKNKKLWLIVAIYSVAGFLALNVRAEDAAPDRRAPEVTPPSQAGQPADEAPLTEAPTTPPASTPPASTPPPPPPVEPQAEQQQAPPQQPKQAPAPQAKTPPTQRQNRPQSQDRSQRARKPRWEDVVFSCGKAADYTFGTMNGSVGGSNWLSCTTTIGGKPTGKRYKVRMDKFGLGLNAVSGKVFHIGHWSDKSLAGEYRGLGASVTAKLLGLSGGGFKKKGSSNNLEFIGGAFLGLEVSVTSAVIIKEVK